VAYRACPLRRCSCLQCVILVDRVPGRSTWGSPTTNKHPWTPEGSKGARGLLTVPYRLPVVSTVLACPPDGSPEDQFDPRRRMDNMCTARVYMPYKECTVRSERERESAASPASPDDAPHAVSASNSAQSAPPARAAARPSLSTCKATGEATFTGCWRDPECRRRHFLFVDQATNSCSYLRRRLLIFDC
jgi:hypothetical protein